MMKKLIYCFVVFIVALIMPVMIFAQSTSVTIYYSGAQSRGCCNVCGTDYMCIGTSGCGCCDLGQRTKTFMDPVPAGNIITSVSVRFYAADCSASNVPTSINGVAICAAVNPGSRTCACGSCNQAYCTANFPCGLTSYNYGGVNTLYANPAPNGTEICPQRVVLTFTYQAGGNNGPPTPGAITGTTTVCTGQTYTYSIASVAGATSYTWTVPSGATINAGQGTTSISVTFGGSGGQICVTATNSCGTSSPSCLNVNLAPPPSPPASITGPATVCPTLTFSYTCSTVTGAVSYNWVVPPGSTVISGQGTNTVQITFGSSTGNVCVSATTNCGTSAQTCIPISFAPPPTSPVSITGNTVVCSGTTQTYSINPVTGATGYTWTVPAGSTINSGQGTTSLNVTMGTTSGSVCVTADNACGSSIPTCLPVTVNMTPVVTNNPMTQSICSGQNTTLVTLTGSEAGTTFTWNATAPAALTGYTTSGTGTIPVQNIINSSLVPENVTYSITPSANGCTGIPTDYIITVKPLPTVTNSPLTSGVCSGQLANVVLTGSIPGTVFTWTASCTAGTVTGFTPSGTGDINDVLNNPLITPGAVSYVITPSVNGCDGPPVTYVVTVSSQPTITNSPTTIDICSGQSPNIVLTSTIVGTTYDWTAINTVGTISGYSAVGNGNLNEILTNSGLTPGTVVYTVTPTVNGCDGSPVDFTINVSEDFTVVVDIAANPANQICFGDTVTFTATPTNGGTAPSYQWQVNGVNVGTNNPVFTTSSLPAGNVAVSCTLTSNSTDCIVNNPATDVYNIVVNALPDATINSSGPYCIDGAPVNLTAGTSGGIWSGTGITDPATGLFNPVIAGVGTHTITYSITDPGTGCFNSSTHDFVVNALPVLVFSPIPDVCINSPAINLNSCSPAGGTYSGVAVINNSFDPASSGMGTFLITYDYTNPLTGCSNSASENITVNMDINISVTPDVYTMCQDDSVSLQANGGNQYFWAPSYALSSTSGNIVTAFPQMTTTYYVTGTDVNGCSGTATVNINIYDYYGLVITATPVQGCAPLKVDFSFNEGSLWKDQTWRWDFDDSYSPYSISYADDPSHVFDQPGTYDVELTVENINGCVETANVQISSVVKPVADFYILPETATTDDPELRFVDQSVNANYWFWTFGDALSGPDNVSTLQNPIHLYTYPGDYSIRLVVESDLGCTDTLVLDKEIFPAFVMFIPNAFTPDGDGTNETFGPVFQGVEPTDYTFIIYDRWGRTVFETNDIYERWDGTNIETFYEAKSQVYLWMVIVKDAVGAMHKELGVVTILL